MILAVSNKTDVLRTLCRRLGVVRLGVLHDGLQVPLAGNDGGWSRPEDLLHVGVVFGDLPPGLDEWERFWQTHEGVEAAFGRPTLLADLDAHERPEGRALDEAVFETIYDARDDAPAA